MFLERKLSYATRFSNVEAVYRKVGYENSQGLIFRRMYYPLGRKMVRIAPLCFAGRFEKGFEDPRVKTLRTLIAPSR